MSDLVQKFITLDKSVRIISVNLEDAWDDSQYEKNYHPLLAKLLGELTAASVLLAANIKFEGSVVLQIQSEGPVSLLVVECTSDFKIRSTIKQNQEYAIKDTDTFSSLLNFNGKGSFAVILDPKDKSKGQQPYQGIVPLLADSVSDALRLYMKQSEQLETLLYLASDKKRSTGLLIQKLPYSGGLEISEEQAQETWSNIQALASTIDYEEMLEVSVSTLIDRLFWETQLLEYPSNTVIWYCPCSKEKVGDMLRMLGKSEIESILSERDNIEVSCQFCGKKYNFDAVDSAQLFIDSSQSQIQDNPKTEH